MARPENIQDNESLVGGFSFGAAKMAAQEEPAPKEAVAVPAKKDESKKTVTSRALVKDYQEMTREEEEWRNVKLNLLLKPSTVKLLDKAARRKEIKSRNDLINYLLEQYFGVE